MEAAGRNPGRALREMMTVLLPGFHPGYGAAFNLRSAVVVARMQALGRNPGWTLRKITTVLLPGFHPGYGALLL
jgi:hypothetical protein